MKNKLISLLVSAALLVIAVAGGTIAFLTDRDFADNVMSIGNIDIEQLEKQWNSDHTALEEFANDKTLYPAIGKLEYAGTDEEHNGAYRYLGMENVVDKYITVKNRGTAPAYVRTIIAFGMGDCSVDEFLSLIGVSVNCDDGTEFGFNGAWTWKNGTVASIDGESYYIMCATHGAPLISKTESVPSLLQFYINDSAESEDIKKLDHDGDGKYSILALTQAVQTGGFDTAEEALEEAFGDITPANITLWFEAEKQ